MKTFEAEAIQIDPALVKVFVHREREQSTFERMKESIAAEGQQEPIEVIDISQEPRKDRERPEGGLYKWGLIAGQGRRQACLELGIKVWAVVKKMNDAERVGRFLSENLNRDPLPWNAKARLVKSRLDQGVSVEDCAKEFFITKWHVLKFRRIVNHTPKDLEKEVADMSMNEAEVFTAQPEDVQRVVLEVVKEDAMRNQLKTVLAKARSIAQDGKELTVAALKASLHRVDDELKRTREKLKLTRLHHSLGPQNIATLLQDKKFRKLLEQEGINVTKFEKLIA